MLLSVALLTSCNYRQARIAGKIAHGIEHAVDESENQDYDVERMDNDYNDDTFIREEQKFAIKGISYTDRGGLIYDIDPSLFCAVNTEEGLYLDCLGTRYLVYKNDLSVVKTIPTIDDIPLDGSPAPKEKYYNVQNYQYKSFDRGNTYFFNIYQKID